MLILIASLNPHLIYGSNMTLYINYHHINYYYMGSLRSIYLGHSYFASSDYMTIQTWTHVMLLHLNHVRLTGTGFHKYTKFYPGMVWYTLAGVASYHIATVLSFFFKHNSYHISNGLTSRFCLTLNASQ